jgi:hypothetical protein
MNPHRALAFCLRMIYFGKMQHTFPDHALATRRGIDVTGDHPALSA